MRQIEFRAWDKNSKKMVKVDHLTWNKGVKGLSEINQEMPKWFILMQYTGLKDKNGKEIYEGDVVLMDGTNKKLYPNWDTQYEPRRKVYIKIEWGYAGFVVGGIDIDKSEIIGNIYENPELLES